MNYEIKRSAPSKINTDPDGGFTGLLSVYKNIDLTGDIVEPGAFSKSLKETGGVIPLLADHRQDRQIGLLRVSDSPSGLRAAGVFMDSPTAQEARRQLAFNMENGVRHGLSIGFRSIKDQVDSHGIRHLLEVQLLEGSTTLFPANTAALVTDVHSAEITRMMADFNARASAILTLSAPREPLSPMLNAMSQHFDARVKEALRVGPSTPRGLRRVGR